MKSLVVIASIHSPEHERLLTAADREYLEKLSSPKRRAEVAAWRAIVRREMGDVTIGYNEVGAPVISVEAEELLCTVPYVAASRMVGAAKDMATGVAKGSATGTTTNAVKWMHISVSHSGDPRAKNPPS